MPDDLWYLKKKGDDKPLPSKRHGRGSRWRVRWTDPITGKDRSELFERRADAERHENSIKADISRGQYIDPRDGQITVAEYAEEWRKSLLQRKNTAANVERFLRLHIVPVLGHLPLAGVRASHIRSWVLDRSAVLAPNSLHRVYSGVLAALFKSALVDRRIGFSPCLGIRLPELVDPQYTIATAEQVHALSEALPKRFGAVPIFAAGCGWRAGEIMGLEPEGLNFLRREAYVRQQLLNVPKAPLRIARPKTRTSVRTNEMADLVRLTMARHLERFPPTTVEIEDETDDPRRPVQRKAKLIFTLENGKPISSAAWSLIWAPAVKAVGLPAGYGLRDLRHFYATVLIYGGASVKTVQKALGHTKPSTTLDVYTGYWPEAAAQNGFWCRTH